MVDRGYVHVHGLVADELVARARAAIDDDLRRNYDPAREDDYGGSTYCPAILDAPAIAPEQLVCAAGDVVLMHWSLAHTAAVNTSDVDRIAVYFRLMFPELSGDRVPDRGEGRWDYLSNLWRGWRVDH